jgi:hypothetical protein
MRAITLALRQAERDKNGSVQSGEQTQHYQIPGSTKSFLANVPVLVYGYGTTNDPFHERAEALSVNGRSGIIILTSAVNPGETLILTNEVNLREEKCVVREVSADSCGTRIVFEFLGPAPDFWDAIQP